MRFFAYFLSIAFLTKWNIVSASYLSFKKSVTSKSLYGNGTPRNAVTDGDDYSVMSSSCFHSNDGVNEWLKIDLEKEYNITKVTIVNRVQSASWSHYRLAGTEVRIGNVYSNLDTAQKCGESVSIEQVETSAIVDLTCDEPVSGRYLMLWHPDQNEFLNLCQIRAYSEYEPEISECSHSQSYSDYRGLVSITENGLLCQKWTSQSPHTHGYAPSDADDNGIGDHNLCRNPGNESRPWCYTTDPDTRWGYCDVADVGTSCPLDTIVDALNAVEIFELNLNCLTSWYASEFLSTMEVDSTCTSDNDIPQPVNTLISVEGNRFQDEVNALTLAMYVYPNGSSSGEILSAGNGNTRLRIEQTYSNGYLFRSEVTVFYGDQQLTRAHVLLPEVWTFLAITFDGTNKNIKLWRDGEIASIGYTDFTNLDLQLNELQLGDASDSLYAKVAMLQIYDRVLNEAEMKAARDAAFENWLFAGHASFTKLGSSFSLTGMQIYDDTHSLLVCSQKCLQRGCCKALRFKRGTNSCILFSKFEKTNSLPDESDVDYYQKDSQSYPVLKHC